MLSLVRFNASTEKVSLVPLTAVSQQPLATSYKAHSQDGRGYVCSLHKNSLEAALILQPHLGRESFDLACIVRSLGSCLMASTPDRPRQYLCRSNPRTPRQSIHQSADFWNSYWQESSVEVPPFSLSVPSRERTTTR